MADCNETLRELYLYLDGQLTEDDRVHIQQHLDDFEAELRLVVRSRCFEEVPEPLRARIAKALEREQEQLG
jgi:mycothiol system anti-sigma-R factor